MKFKRLEIYLLMFILLGSVNLSGQEKLQIKAVVLDSVTGGPVPYATVSIQNKPIGTICSYEGQFKLNIFADDDVSDTDSIDVSCVGYASKVYSISDVDSVVLLSPSVKELDEVIVSNKHMTVEDIIDEAEESLDEVYQTDYSKQKVFIRSTSSGGVVNLDYELKESSIPEVNEDFIDTVVSALPRNDIYCFEAICNTYGTILTDDDDVKFEVPKSAEIFRRNDGGEWSKVEEKAEFIFNNRIKRDSYFKVKSGIIGTKVDLNEESDDLPSLENVEDTSQAVKNHFIESNIRNEFNKVCERTFMDSGSDLSFIHSPSRYSYNLDGYAVVNGDLAYKISFEPKRRAEMKGVVYINVTDFAVLRVEYENTEPVFSFSLFKIEVRTDVYKGIMMFERDKTGKYILKYYDHTKNDYYRVHRPLTVIEKNKNTKGRRKQNEVRLEFDVSGNSTTKIEYIVLESDNITEDQYDNKSTNSTVRPEYLPKYDPSFWSDYNVIEPNGIINSYRENTEH